MTETVSDELAPCPFCGGELLPDEYTAPGVVKVYRHLHNGCFLNGVMRGVRNLPEDIAEWNSRTPPQNTDGEAVAMPSRQWMRGKIAADPDLETEALSLAPTVSRVASNLGIVAAEMQTEKGADHAWTLVCVEAASALSAMKAERDALEAEMADWRNGDLRGVKAHMDAFMARAEAAEAERDALAKALEPFAATAEQDIGESETDEDIFQQATHNRAPQITVGHFRRALAALQREVK